MKKIKPTITFGKIDIDSFSLNIDFSYKPKLKPKKKLKIVTIPAKKVSKPKNNSLL